MMSAYGKEFQEVNPEMGGIWKSGSIFVVKDVSDVLDVKRKWKKVSLGKIAIIIWRIDH